MQEVADPGVAEEFDARGNRVRFRLYHNGGSPVVLNGKPGERRAFKKARAKHKAEMKRALGKLRRRDGKRLDTAEFQKRVLGRLAVAAGREGSREAE